MELKELLSGLKISIVVPVFNEEGNVEVVAQSLSKVLFDTDFDILFIDDGSSDRTLHLLKILHQENERINYLSFSRNFGHQAALKAGLDHSTGDCVITMDGDMEHPVDLLPEMLENWQKGFGVVVTSRGENKNLGIFKRLSSKLFYKIMNLLSEVELKPGSSDFRLLDRKVVNAIKQMPETPVFLRAMISWLGFSQHVIKYQPGHRFSGHSKYSKKKMINFSIEGITSFSIKPLRLASIVGLLLATL